MEEGKGITAADHYPKCGQAGREGSSENDACRDMIDACADATAWPFKLVTDRGAFTIKDFDRCVIFARVLAGKGFKLSSTAQSKAPAKPESQKPPDEPKGEPEKLAPKAKKSLADECSDVRSWPYKLTTDTGKSFLVRNRDQCMRFASVLRRRGEGKAGSGPSTPMKATVSKPTTTETERTEPSRSKRIKDADGIPSGILTLKTVAQARREIIEKGYPSWVIVGSSGCPPCKEMKDKMEKAQRRGGDPKSRIAFVDMTSDEGFGIIRELGLYDKFELLRSIPQLYHIGRGTGADKSRMSLHEKYPEHFDDIDLETLFSKQKRAKLTFMELLELDRKFSTRRFNVADGVIKAIGEGRL